MIAGLSSWFAIAPLHEIFFSTADRRAEFPDQLRGFCGPQHRRGTVRLKAFWPSAGAPQRATFYYFRSSYLRARRAIHKLIHHPAERIALIPSARANAFAASHCALISRRLRNRGNPRPLVGAGISRLVALVRKPMPPSQHIRLGAALCVPRNACANFASERTEELTCLSFATSLPSSLTRKIHTRLARVAFFFLSSSARKARRRSGCPLQYRRAAPCSGTSYRWSEDVSEHVAHELRRRRDLQMREIPSAIADFVERCDTQNRRQTDASAQHNDEVEFCAFDVLTSDGDDLQEAKS
jgi:hypothetical protein